MTLLCRSIVTKSPSCPEIPKAAVKANFGLPVGGEIMRSVFYYGSLGLEFSCILESMITLYPILFVGNNARF